MKRMSVSLLFLVLSSTPLLSQTVSCNCYRSNDCRARQALCQLGQGCRGVGKYDGLCDLNAASVKKGGGHSGTLSSADRTAITGAIDAYFKSFMVAIEKGGGNPDPTLFATAQGARLPQTEHLRIKNVVWTVLDAMMGWDFMYPTKEQIADGYPGNVREVHGVSAAGGIVDAARKGLLEAVATDDESKVEAPLKAFWTQYPNYVPRHLGRCYPHGHDDLTDSAGTYNCQLSTLQRAVRALTDPNLETPDVPE